MVEVRQPSQSQVRAFIRRIWDKYTQEFQLTTQETSSQSHPLVLQLMEHNAGPPAVRMINASILTFSGKYAVIQNTC